MTQAHRERLEHDIRSLCQLGDFAGGATTAIRGFGPELEDPPARLSRAPLAFGLTGTLRAFPGATRYPS
jgi:hypothetical protein